MPPTVLLLDDAALSDDLFVRGFGRMLAGASVPLVLVHGDGGTAARALEAAAVFDAAPHQIASMRAQATYARNRQLAALWSDGGAVLTGLSGEGRPVLVYEDGRLAARPRQVEALRAQGIVPLVAALAPDADGHLHAVPLVDAAAALARALGASVALLDPAALPGGRPFAAPVGAGPEQHPQLDARERRAFEQAGVDALVTTATALLAAAPVRPQADCGPESAT